MCSQGDNDGDDDGDDDVDDDGLEAEDTVDAHLWRSRGCSGRSARTRGVDAAFRWPAICVNLNLTNYIKYKRWPNNIKIFVEKHTSCTYPAPESEVHTCH